MSDAITEALRAAQKPIQRYLWVPDDAITFTPSVLEETFGDGRALFALTTINNRPAYWIIRGCSTWQVAFDHDAPRDAPEFPDFVDEIIATIENEFGSTCGYEMNSRGIWIDQETGRFIPPAWAEYPTIDSNMGCSWGRLDWPELEGVDLQPHPFGRCNMLA